MYSHKCKYIFALFICLKQQTIQPAMSAADEGERHIITVYITAHIYFKLELSSVITQGCVQNMSFTSKVCS